MDNLQWNFLMHNFLFKLKKTKINLIYAKVIKVLPCM
jgi:hypothetical protein